MIALGLAAAAGSGGRLGECVSNGHGSHGGGVSAHNGAPEVPRAGWTESDGMGHAPSDAER